MINQRHLHIIVALAALLLPASVCADVWQDPTTHVNYEYTPGQGKASVMAGTWRKAGSPDATGDITLLSSFTVEGNSYSVTTIW